MAPNDDLLRRLCAKSETLLTARSLLRTAQAKTAPGSGHELGAATTGLAAICACIASDRLNNADVAQGVAQKASCLAPREFARALRIVKLALGEADEEADAPTPAPARAAPLSYETLISRHCRGARMRQAMVAWMTTAEHTLASEHSAPVDPTSAAVRCAVFAWTCDTAEVASRPTHAILLAAHGVPKRAFTAFLATLDKSPLKERLQEEASARLQSDSSQTKDLRSLRSLSRSPTKSPSKSSLKSSLIPALATPTRTSPRKRAIELPADTGTDTDGEADAGTTPITTPTKRRRMQPVPPASFPQPVLNPRPVTPEADVEEADADTDVPPRRFRPVYLDQQQWRQRDPRPARVLKWGAEHNAAAIAVFTQAEALVAV